MRGPGVLRCGIWLAALVACQCTTRPKDDPEKQALERRIIELEARLQALSTPTPGSPRPAFPPSTAMPRPSSTPRRAAPAPTPRPPAVESRAPHNSRAAPPFIFDDDMTYEPLAEATSAREPAHEPLRERAAPPAVAEHWSIPDGAQLELTIETALSSRASVVGDPVVARIERVVDADGPLPLPGGSVIEGAVTRVRGAGRVGRQALLSVVFQHITVRGRRLSLEPISVTLEGRSDTARDGKLVAGGAAAGALVGGLLGGERGARRGAAIGGAGAAGAAAATKAEELDLAPGERWTVTVTRADRAQRE